MKTMEVLDKLLKGKDISSKTKRNYTDALSSLSKFSDEYPTNAGTINEWIASLTHLRDTTKRLYWRLAKSASNYMYQIYDTPSPFIKATRPKVEKRQRRYFSSQELLSIIAACRDDYERALIMTLIDSTSRIGELATLIRRNINGTSIISYGKTGERKHRLDTRICSILRSMVTDDEALVFSAYNHSPNVDAMKAHVRAIIKRAGLKGEKLGTHSLRHASASLIARKTKSALAVKAILGQDDIKTSMIYIHDVEDDMAQETSPLQLLSEDVFGSSEFQVQKPLQITDGTTPDEAPVSLYLDLFPSPNTNTKIRPLLSSTDLELLRTVFAHYCESTEYSPIVSDLKALYNRMTRKARLNVHSP